MSSQIKVSIFATYWSKWPLHSGCNTGIIHRVVACPASAPVFLVAYSVYQGGLGKLFDVGELGGIWVHFRNRRVASGSSPNLKRLSSQIERPGRFIEVRKFDYCNGPSKSKSSRPSELEDGLEEE